MEVLYLAVFGACVLSYLTGNIVMWFHLVRKHHLYEED